MTKKLLYGTALASLMAFGLWLPALAQDAGNLGKGKPTPRTSARRPIRHTRSATFRRGRSSATRICTPRFPWTPAHSALG